MTHGSLFSGIGGIDLGFEWAGIETKWQVEIDPYCRELLGKRFPNAKQFEDVKTVGSHNLEKVDIVSGGFPCQDISIAGKGKGLAGERSGLWSELHRIIGELRPRFAFIENVPMLTIRGGVRVIADLAEIGYDAEWTTLSASNVGANHKRERLWIVAYPESQRLQTNKIQEREFGEGDKKEPKQWKQFLTINAGNYYMENWEAFESELCGTDYGVPGELDRLKGLGNAVVPHIPYIIGKRLKELCQKNQAEKPS